MTGFSVNTNENILTAGYNDLYIDDTGLLVTTNTVVEFIQAIRSGLWMWLGEYAYNTTIGIDYQEILGNTAITDEIIQDQIKTAINLQNSYLSTTQQEAYGVKSIDSIIINRNASTRIATVLTQITLNNNQTITFDDMELVV